MSPSVADVWKNKDDDALRAAAQSIDDYSDEGAQAIRDELARRGFSAPPMRSKKPTNPFLGRYRDAYAVARSIIGTGTTIKWAGTIGAVLIVAVAVAERNAGLFVPAVVAAAVVALTFLGLGTFICAQGQLLRATLDTAVHTSPLLDNEEKAVTMEG